MLRILNVYDSNLSSDYNLIEDHLFLGNITAAETPSKLKELNIKRVLSLLDKPIVDSKKSRDINYYYIKVGDDPKEDLLSHFDKCYEIINDAIQNAENIYVHCLAGASRSATIVIAYLMKEYQLSYDDAVRDVNPKRMVFPNSGFIRQLRMYENMNYVLDGRRLYYRYHLLKSLIYERNQWSYNNEEKRNFSLMSYFEKLGNAESNQTINRGCEFTCNGCGYVLFNEISIIKTVGSRECNDNDNIYIEPQQWMSDQIVESIDGPILCPKCSKHLGLYNWERFTCLCPLHKKVSCLGFKIFSENVKSSKEN